MVSQLWDNANDWGIGALTSMVTNLQNDLNNLSSQLGNYDTSTLEWSQAISALNNRIGIYKNAIQQYTDLINEIKSAASEARRGSGIKQQAKQWYITGLSTKRWMTHAEAMKDMADIEATWRAERAEVRGQEQENLASARWGLAEIYKQMWGEQADIDATSWNGWSSSSSSGWLTSALSDYINTRNNITADAVNGVMGNPNTTTTETISEQKPTKKKNTFGSLYVKSLQMLPYTLPGPEWTIMRINAARNIFKKLTNK